MRSERRRRALHRHDGRQNADGPQHYEQMHPDQHALVFDPGNPNIAFVGLRRRRRADRRHLRRRLRASAPRATASPRAPVDLADCQQWLSQDPAPDREHERRAGHAAVRQTSPPTRATRRRPHRRHPGQRHVRLLAATPRARGSSRSTATAAPPGSTPPTRTCALHTFFLGLADVNHHGADPHKWTFITQPILESGEAVSFYTPLVADPKVSGTVFIGAQHIWRTKDNGGDQAQLEAHCAGPGGVPAVRRPTITCGDFVAAGAGPDRRRAADRGGQYIASMASARRAIAARCGSRPASGGSS